MKEAADAMGCRIARNLRVPMRDGVSLATTVYLPRGEGPWPVVLVRTAYNRVGIFDSFFPSHGMALVTQDCRGRYDSEGAHTPFVAEPADGVDTLDWLGRQPWCNGRIGMFGDSYLAAVQFAVGPSAHPLLKALNPRFMSADCWKRAYYCDGAFSLALTWSWLAFECTARVSEAGMMPLFNVRDMLRHLPIAEMDVASGAPPVPAYRDYVTRNRYDEGWRGLNVMEQCAAYRTPVLLTGGWYDNYAAEAARLFLALRAAAPSAELRDSHRLLIGPWTHGFNRSTVLGAIDFGPASVAELDSSQRWLDCMLHGRGAAAFQQAPVRIFVMGANEWRDLPGWPPPGMRPAPLYLRAGGRLAPAAPGNEAPDTYVYDPADPVPTTGGNHSVGPYNPGLYDFVKPGPLEQRAVEEREDVLVYTGEPLGEDLEIIGPVVMKLHAASEAFDTDFVARLTDVHPDGRSINITEGVIRARFREDVWGPPKALEPGRVCEYTIDMQVTAHRFKAGHRIRVHVTSSNFPLWDRNLNTGNDPAWDTELRAVRQTVHHDRLRPSRVLLPVCPTGCGAAVTR